MARPVSSTEIPCMADKDPNKTYVCPYNIYHVITASKFPSHMANCRKMYTGDKFATCPFNARHEFPAVEYNFHIDTCPDKNIIERELTSVPAPNVPQVNHHPEWNQPDPTEDWDAEADLSRPGFSLQGVPRMDEPRNALNVIEEYQNELGARVSALSTRQTPTVNGDMSGLSKALKKNRKRAEKRREQHMARNGGDQDNRVEDEPHEMTSEEKEQKLRQIAREYGKQADAFVDWVSILNQYCQKNKINQPKYAEAPNPLGGFGASVVVTTERFFSDSVCKTKKEAKHSAARAALLGLNIAVCTPDPCRAPHQRGGDVQRMRELETNMQLLESTIQANQQRIIPGLSQSTLSNSSSRPEASQRPSNSNASSTERVTSQMAGVSHYESLTPDDEWHVVGRRTKDKGRAPGTSNNNALRLAGRGRGRGRSSSR